MLLSERTQSAADPQLAQILEVMAEDEARHAELAWRFVRWALGHDEAAVRPLLLAELRRMEGPCRPEPELDTADEALLAAHGLASSGCSAACERVVQREIVAVCARAMLEVGATGRVEDAGEPLLATS